MKRDMDEHRQKMQMERQDMTSDVRGILNKHAQSIVVHLKVWQSKVFLSTLGRVSTFQFPRRTKNSMYYPLIRA